MKYGKLIIQFNIILYLFNFFKSGSDILNVSGIIAEFNPLHRGHEYLIKTAKENGPVVAVISGNFVQRGDVSVAEKRVRTKMALESGVDLVLELPVLWSMSTAQNFALGGVSVLGYAGCDRLFFGSECGNIEDLRKTADILLSPEFALQLEKLSYKKETFAKLRQEAAESCGVPTDILKKPNNNLAVEYILAARKNGISLDFSTVKRVGAMHDSLCEEEFVSASLLREKLKQNDFDYCKKYMPQSSLRFLNEGNIANIARIERAILAFLRTRTTEELQKLPDLSEGVENKLFEAVRVAESLDMLYNEIKVKRYTLARVRRLVLSAFLGADNQFFMKSPPYIRVLGFNKTGEQIIKTRLKNSPVPVVTTVAEVKKLNEHSQKVFSLETRATDLFSLSLPQALPCGLEYKSKIIKTGVF